MRSAAPSPQGFAQSHPGATIMEMPLSDGGEGLLDVLRGPLSLQLDRKHRRRSPGPQHQGPLWPFADGETAWWKWRMPPACSV